MPIRASGPIDAKLAFVGMGPAKEEMATGVPFMGPSGQIFNKALSTLGVSRKDVYVTNVHDEYLQAGTSLFSLPKNILDASIVRLKHELEAVRPNVVVPLGDEALYILCGQRGITKWRGSILPSTLVPGLKCVPSIHTAWILRGMWKWLPVFTHIDLARAIDEAKPPNMDLPERNAITGPSYNTVMDFIGECYKHEYLSMDIETFGWTEHGTGEIACLGIGYHPSQALCIPIVKSGGFPYWGEKEECQIWKAYAALVQNRELKKVGQNLSFEWIYHWVHGIYPSDMYIDTMLLHHTLYPDWGATEDLYQQKRRDDEPGHSLAFINSHYTRTPYYKDDGKRWSPGVGDHAFWTYNAKDVMVTLEAAFKMMEEAKEEGQWDVYVEFQQKPFQHCCRAEWFGVAIDQARRGEAGVELAKQMIEIQDRIDQKLGRSLNVQSSKQMQELLYKQMGFKPKMKKTKKPDGTVVWRPTADKDAMREFAEKSNDPVLGWIQELKEIKDLKSDIVDQKLGPDNRMHTHWKQGGTDTNRWSSTKGILGTGMNFQNVPVKGIARKLFVPE